MKRSISPTVGHHRGVQLSCSHHEATHAKMNVIIIQLQKISHGRRLAGRWTDGWMDGFPSCYSDSCRASAADLTVIKKSVSSTKPGSSSGISASLLRRRRCHLATSVLSNRLERSSCSCQCQGGGPPHPQGLQSIAASTQQ